MSAKAEDENTLLGKELNQFKKKYEWSQQNAKDQKLEWEAKIHEQKLVVESLTRKL